MDEEGEDDEDVGEDEGDADLSKAENEPSGGLGGEEW